MFNYVTNMKAAAKDTAARYGMTAAAGAIFVVALGFLLGALWVWLAQRWGSLNTNLAFAGGFTVVALITLAVARSRHAEPPTVEDLRDEVEAKIAETANHLINRAEAKVNRIVGDTEQRVANLARSTSEQINQAVGFTPELLKSARGKAFQAGIIPPLLGAFMVGLNLAVKLRRK